ncbi:hypothetical protein Tsp_06189 [Trichinella spiralis]|uniref:hypothetical protein n=1 Tax=Trichinella spiralis TaxID=6334 RepID=UPI0001EFBC1B|nr:hypothetical protein Tsp_06189 [Trichinella spiralis]
MRGNRDRDREREYALSIITNQYNNITCVENIKRKMQWKQRCNTFQQISLAD